MFTEPRILHVDDDEGERDMARDYLEGEQIPKWGVPRVVGAGDIDSALRCLEAERFDLVILDVRRQSDPNTELLLPDEELGARMLAEIRERRFVPVIFWTGLPSRVEHLRGPLVSVLEKTERLPRLHDQIVEVFRTRLPAVNRALRQLVEDEQRRYMWEFVAEHWEQLGTVDDHTALAYLLARRLARSISGPGIQRMAASLGDTAQGTAFAAGSDDGLIHAVEMYIQPPIEESALQSGDLLRGCLSATEDGWWVVLSPSCDLLHRKAEHVLLAAATPLDEHPSMVDWKSTRSKGAQKRVEEIVHRKTSGQHDRWLYLPSAIDVPDLVVDMQELASVRREKVDLLKRVASLDSPFAEEAVNRFGRYYGRVGTPDIPKDLIMKRLEGALADCVDESAQATADADGAPPADADESTSSTAAGA